MKSHPTDWTSLIGGAVFLTIGAGAIISAETGLIGFDLRWVWPGLFLLLAVGVLASVRGRTQDQDPATAKLPKPPA